MKVRENFENMRKFCQFHEKKLKIMVYCQIHENMQKIIRICENPDVDVDLHIFIKLANFNYSNGIELF